MENRIRRNPALKNLVDNFEAMSIAGAVMFPADKPYFELINFFEEEMQLEKALDVVEYAIEQFQFRSDFYIIKARLLFLVGNIEHSLEVLDVSDSIAPFEFEARTLRAKLFAAQGLQNLAIAIVDDLKSYVTHSDKVDLLLCEGYIYETNNDFEAMFQCLKKALIIDPRNHAALRQILLSVELSKNYEESILLYKLIINEDPYSFMAWYNLGHAYSCVGDYELAIDAYEYSFLIKSDFETGYLDCAELCFQMRQYKRALDIYNEITEKFGQDTEVLVNAAHCEFQLGDVLNAKAHLRHSLKIDPYDDEALYLLANCLMFEERWVVAINTLKNAISIDEEREEYYHSIARCYMNIGDFKKAKNYYALAAETGVEQSNYWEEYVSFLIKIGDTQEALDVIEQAEDFTYSDKLMYCKAYLYLKNNDKQQAMSFLEEALLENGDNSKFLLDLAPELKQNKEVLSAIKYFTGDPRNIEV